MDTQQRAVEVVDLRIRVNEIHSQYEASRRRGAGGNQLTAEVYAYGVLKRDYDCLSAALSRTKSPFRSIGNWYRVRVLQHAAVTYIKKFEIEDTIA